MGKVGESIFNLNFQDMKDRGSVSVFKGSVVEADQVHDVLEQNDIGSLVRNHMQENLAAGWMVSDAEHAAEVFVAEEDKERALALVKDIFSEGPSNPNNNEVME